jgi:uncharacterized protein YjbI with pentapeptide repeats
MANPEHLEILKQGVAAWNAWRQREPSVYPDLSEADLHGAHLEGANLSRADLTNARLGGAQLTGASLNEADLSQTDLSEARLEGASLRMARGYQVNLTGAKLSKTSFEHASLMLAILRGADLSDANLGWAKLENAFLQEAVLKSVNFQNANLFGADLRGTVLSDEAILKYANLSTADLSGADLSGADLERSILVDTNLQGANLTGCRIHGVSAWGVKLDQHCKQHNLIVTERDEPKVTVDNIEVAQFIYLLLHNEKIRDVIDTVGKKGVLLLGRFTEGRIVVLERLRDELRNRGYLPIVFNFDKPETKDFTETVRLLAGMAKFVIADITNPKSAPLELQATIPEIMIPFRPIIEEGEKPFAMLQDLWIKHREWVFEPIYYSSLDALVGALDDKIIRPAEVRFAELLARKAETMRGEHV